MIHASYSAMLLVQLKHNQVVNGVWQPSGDMITAPMPLPNAFEAPSKYIDQSGSLLRSFIRSRCFTVSYQHDVLIRKLKIHRLVIIHDLMCQMIRQHTPWLLFWVVYWISYLVKIIYNLAILPDKAGLSKIYLIGSIFDINRVVWVSIYCLTVGKLFAKVVNSMLFSARLVMLPQHTPHWVVKYCQV